MVRRRKLPVRCSAAAPFIHSSTFWSTSSHISGLIDRSVDYGRSIDDDRGRYRTETHREVGQGVVGGAVPVEAVEEDRRLVEGAAATIGPVGCQNSVRTLRNRPICRQDAATGRPSRSERFGKA